MNVLKEPDAEVTRSPMGGGWIIPLTPAGTQALMEFYEEEPAEIGPIVRCGYIVEPWQAGDLGAFLKLRECTWRVS